MADTNCLTRTIELSAFVSWTFTGILEPIFATWSTGQVAHKITVVPPGQWSWDATITSCEQNHYQNEYIQSGSFFSGNLEILGPSTICPGDLVDLTVESDGYNFPFFSWDPPVPSGDISPYPISAPGLYTLFVFDDLGCLSIDQIDVSPATYLFETEDIFFCPGESVTIDGQVYNQSGTVVDTIPSSSGGCDTIATYLLTLLPHPLRSESIIFCPGESVTIDGQVYNQSGTVVDTIPSVSGGCDTIATYLLTLSPHQIRTDSISFCIGESVVIDGQVYNQSGVLLDTIFSTGNGCDTLVTYVLTQLPYQTRTESISFCPGESINIGGQLYSQAGTVVDTLPSISACDTIVTYTLQFLTPAPSTVGIACPNNMLISQPSSAGAVVNYNKPIAMTDCICPGTSLLLTSGLPSGSNFPLGITQVCYEAKDSCGQTASCCFNITVEEDDDEPCDTKVNGCLKYELLSITEDLSKKRTYRIRVTNNCANKLIYSAIQVPDGFVAIEPANFSVYSAPSGNTYRVRNPNFTPQYSIRFSSISDSINLGESDIFKYTLPAGAAITSIHCVSRLTSNIYLSAHLNTFDCPIGITPGSDRPNGERGGESPLANGTQLELFLFPNPSNNLVRVETEGLNGVLLLQDAVGRVLLRQTVQGADISFSVAGLPQGIYQVLFVGEKTTLRSQLVVQR